MNSSIYNGAILVMEFAEAIGVVVISVGMLQNLIYLWQLVLAACALQRRPIAINSDIWRRYSDSAPPIALLSPAFNEEATVIESVRSLLGLQYPAFEIIVINDGSRDNTLGVLIEVFGLKQVQRNFDAAARCQPIRGIYAAANLPRLVVVDKDHGGKADALNAGINVARAPVVCSLDADSLLEPDALLRAAAPFIEDPDKTIAVGGAVRVANGCTIDHGRLVRVGLPRNFLALLQSIEYLRAFLMARVALSEAGLLTIVSGAFGLFRRDIVLAVGGYSHGTVGEDMELVMKLHRYCLERRQPYRVVFVPEPVCWTEVPETLRILGRQRARWQRGSLETFHKHRTMLFNPKYGRIGFLALGNVLLFDVVGPSIEAVGYLLIPAFWFLGLLSLDYFEAFLAASFVFGIFISVGALALEEIELRRLPDAGSLVRLMIAAVAENFGYRQLNNFWRLRGTWQYLNKRTDWGTMPRRGFKPR